MSGDESIGQLCNAWCGALRCPRTFRRFRPKARQTRELLRSYLAAVSIEVIPVRSGESMRSRALLFGGAPRRPSGRATGCTGSDVMARRPRLFDGLGAD